MSTLDVITVISAAIAAIAKLVAAGLDRETLLKHIARLEPGAVEVDTDVDTIAQGH